MYRCYVTPRSEMKKNEELNFEIGWTKGIFPFARTGSLERNSSYWWDWKVEVQEYGRGSYASSLVFIKMWLQQHDTKLHKLNAYACTCFLVLNMMCKMPKCSLKINLFWRRNNDFSLWCSPIPIINNYCYLYLPLSFLII